MTVTRTKAFSSEFSGRRLLSDLVSARTYAETKPDGKKETHDENVERVTNMHVKRFPKFEKEIREAFKSVHDRLVLPSMRTMQFAGRAIERSHARNYNCCACNVTSFRDIADIMWFSMNGCGVGYSVQTHHVAQLPVITNGDRAQLVRIEDTKEAWALSIISLLENPRVRFDYSLVRPEGSKLSSGGLASGPKPLRDAHENIRKILLGAVGRKLRPVEVHHIICHQADAVVVGGVRRTALISLFSFEDSEMLSLKAGHEWREHSKHLENANNSVVLARDDIFVTEKMRVVMDQCFNGFSGEPGIFMTNDMDAITNPCVPAGTEILTRNGYREISSLVGTEVEVWNGWEWSKVTPKVTGHNQKLVRVVLDNGQELVCTPAHKWVIWEGFARDGEARRITAAELRPEMQLIKHDYPVVEFGTPANVNAYAQGFYAGDGSSDSASAWVYWTKEMCVERLNAKKISGSFDSKERRVFAQLDVVQDKTFVPFDWNVKGRLDWFAGLLDSDGTFLKDGQVQVTSINRNFLIQTQKMLTTLGVASKVKESHPARATNIKGQTWNCQATHRLLVNAAQVQSLVDLGLKCERLSLKHDPQRDATRFVRVESVEDAGMADVVYCFTEEKRHTGCFDGIVTGQCGEIALRDGQACNLSEINVAACLERADFMRAVRDATIIGTLQASYTDFDFVQSKWRRNCEKEALLGVSITGQAENWPFLTANMLQEGGRYLLDVNAEWAGKLGINISARSGCTKPSGSASTYLMTTPGIHGAYDDFFLRRMIIEKNSPLAQHLMDVFGLGEAGEGRIVEQDYKREGNIQIAAPHAAPDAINAGRESATSQLNRYKHIRDNWIVPTHRSGPNTHNVSMTCTYREEEREQIKEWMSNNIYCVSGIAFFPHSGGTFKATQMPFESITRDEYAVWHKKFEGRKLDLTSIDYNAYTDTRIGEVACAGGACLVL